jgi:isopenicillin N synthase-like dioxygenase
MNRNEIPVIDLTHARSGSALLRKDIARQIDRASREIGFFVVTGTGIPEQVIGDAHQTFARFVALPVGQKNACRIPGSATHPDDPYTPYGYSAVLEENAFAYAGEAGRPSDYVEKFSLGRLALDPRVPLPFPPDADCPGLRAALVDYFRETRDLAALLAGLVEEGFGFPSGFLTDRMTRAADSMRCHHYPARSDAHANDQGMGTHQDGSLVTLLTQTAPGIEVQSKDGQWMRPSGMGLFDYLVNIGDLLSCRTDGEYSSTPHRVVLTDQARISIAFFKLTDEDQSTEAGDRQMDALFGR